MRVKRHRERDGDLECDSDPACERGPARVARHLLAGYDAAPGLVTHRERVAAVARYLAARMRERGCPIDVEMTFAGALLHDIGRVPAVSGDPRYAGPDHAAAGAQVVRLAGHPVLAEIVARHNIEFAGDPVVGPRTLEEKVVHFADKVVAQDLQTVRARVADLVRRYPERREFLARAVERVVELEAEILRAAGLTFADLQTRFPPGGWGGNPFGAGELEDRVPPTRGGIAECT